MVGSRSTSKTAVYAALFGNLGIAISKLIAALLTGSTSMWAETYHSFSDTLNQILLLLGIRTSKKKGTERHPFGYGKEQFFWSFIVATLIFGISGVLSLEQGLGSLLGSEIHRLENVSISYLILAISFVFEGNALRIALGLFKNTIEDRGEKFTILSVIKEFKESKDTSILTVVVEDSAALLGITIAAIALYLSDITGNLMYDAVGSILIGCTLMAFAFFLARENKELLIGESISKRDYKLLFNSVSGISEVNKIISIRTMHLAPEDVLIAIEVSLIDNLDTDAIELVIDKIENTIKQVIPYAVSSKIYVELERPK
ncbi:MAG TPA: cation diffusion facilitator family transporter [Candidatus Nitrosocosmicus sp.]|nr:cation diffusion facilitator family transporter [Candidatus Nitrosocosmicus sp.]